MKAIRLVRNEYGDFVAQEGGYYGLYYSKLEADAEFARLEDELKRYQKDRCEHCGATINKHGCPSCGAPECCPQCCTIARLEAEVERLTESMKILFRILGPAKPTCIGCATEVEEALKEIKQALSGGR